MCLHLFDLKSFIFFSDEDCLALYTEFQFNWVDYPCSYPLYYVCEKEPIIGG